MAFVFRFQQLLRIAEHEENEVKNRLAKKDGQIANENREIDKFKEEFNQALEQQSFDLQQGDMVKLQMYPAYLARLQKSWEFHEEELERLEKQREKIILELLEKRKNRKTYDIMKENDKKAYIKEQQKKDQARLDEFGNRLKRQEENYDDAK